MAEAAARAPGRRGIAAWLLFVALTASCQAAPLRSHAELVRRNGLYGELYATQAAAYR